MKILDLERAAKVTGARFAVYWGVGARLERALINFMLDVHTREHGYTEVLPPFMVNSASFSAPDNCPNSPKTCSNCENTDYWLVPTAEVPVTNLFRDETLNFDELPISLVRLHALLPQRGRIVRARRARHHPPAPVPESGAGEVRSTRNRATTDLEKLTADAEDILQRLGLPYRTVTSLHRRHGLLFRQDLRHRSLAARPERIQRNLVVFQLRGLSGAARVHPLPNPARQSRSSCTRSTAAASPSAAPGSPSSKTISKTDGSVVVPEALRPYMNAERIVARG